MPELTPACRKLDEELDRRFGAAGSELSESARLHLVDCQRCRKLYAWMERTAPPEFVPESTHEVVGKLRASLTPVSPRQPMPLIACRFGIVLLFAVGTGIAILRPVGADRMNGSQLTAMSVILVTGAALLSLCLAHLITPGSLQRISPFKLVAIFAGAFSTGILGLFPWHTPQPFFARGLPCLGIGLGLATAAAFLLWLVARRGVPVRMGGFGIALGAMAGLAGVGVLQFTCDRQEVEHLLPWHGAVLLIAILLGALGSREYFQPDA